ncbi:MAG: methyltransferase domain-containing protein [Epsilonproteobacteria bacterium]|nr:methyltransferase domain-containing protein [Campylobacterota bacterium]
MEAVAQIKQKSTNVKESLKFLYFKILKIYRIFLNSIYFLKEFKKDMFSIGAIAQSSNSLSKYIIDITNLKEKKTVVELGSGTGVFTKEITKKLSKSATFFTLELSQFFAEKTKQNCPNVKVYNDDAKNIQKYLNDNDKEFSDCIISGLPWSCFDENKQKELIENIYNSLEDKGEFLTFAYIQSSFLPQGKRFKRLLEETFKVTIQTKTVWLNFPPAYVYVCTK